MYVSCHHLWNCWKTRLASAGPGFESWSWYLSMEIDAVTTWQSFPMLRRTMRWIRTFERSPRKAI